MTAFTLLVVVVMLIALVRVLGDQERTAASSELADSLTDARILPQGDELLIQGRHRGEEVWLEQSSAVPGTLCRVVCAAPAPCRGTIKADDGGRPPRFVGGPTSTLPASLTSGSTGEALGVLLARCPFVRIRADQVEVLVENVRDLPVVIDALTGLTLALRGPPTLQVALRERDVNAACPYCRETIDESESIACGSCATQHHVACLLEHGRCTVLACGERPAPRVREGS